MEAISNDEFLRAQRELDPKEDLYAYAGEWVLLRKGWLVAHDPDLVKLAAVPERRLGDAVVFVSSDPEDTVLV